MKALFLGLLVLATSANASYLDNQLTLRLSQIPRTSSVLTIRLQKVLDDPDNGPQWRQQLIQAAQAPISPSYPCPVIDSQEIAEALGLAESNLRLDYFMATYGGTVKAVYKSGVLSNFFDGNYHQLSRLIADVDPSSPLIEVPLMDKATPWLAYPTVLTRMTNLQSVLFYWRMNYWYSPHLPSAFQAQTNILPFFMLLKTHPAFSKLTSVKIDLNAITEWPEGWTQGLQNLEHLNLAYSYENSFPNPTDLFRFPHLSTFALHTKINLPSTGYSAWRNLSSLNLSNSMLVTLPAELSVLVQLKVLNLKNNGFLLQNLAPFPDILAALTNLEVLDLSGNNYDDKTFPFNPGPGVLPKLRVLNLAGNSNITTLPDAIGSLTSLEDINVPLYHADFIPKSLIVLPSLRTFSCLNYQSIFWQSIVGMTQLTSLTTDFPLAWLGFGARLGLPPLTGLTSLSAKCTGPDDSAYLTKLTALEKLTLTSAGIVLDNPPRFDTLSNLTELDISTLHTPYLQAELGQLPRLRSLSTWCAPMFDGVWPALTRLTLKDPDAIPAAVGSCVNLEELRIICGAGGGQYGSLPRELIYLTKLTSLDLYNDRQDTIQGNMEVIYLLETLQQLSLESCGIPIITDNIRYLTQLVSLNLSVYNMQQISPRLGDLVRLRALIMGMSGGDSSQITSMPSTITNLTNLVQLDVSALNLKSLPQIFFDLGVNVYGYPSRQNKNI